MLLPENLGTRLLKVRHVLLLLVNKEVDFRCSEVALNLHKKVFAARDFANLFGRVLARRLLVIGVRYLSLLLFEQQAFPGELISDFVDNFDKLDPIRAPRRKVVFQHQVDLQPFNAN